MAPDFCEQVDALFEMSCKYPLNDRFFRDRINADCFSLFHLKSWTGETGVSGFWKHPILIIGCSSLVRLACYLYDRYVSEEDSHFVELVESDLEEFLENVTLDNVLLFPPVNNYLRLLIHKTVEQFPVLYSFSVGEGGSRRTVVCLKAAVKSEPIKRQPLHSYRSTIMRGRGRGRVRGPDSPSHSPSGRQEAGDERAVVDRKGPVQGGAALKGTPAAPSSPSAPRVGRGNRARKRPDIQVYVPRGRRLQQSQGSREIDSRQEDGCEETLTTQNSASGSDSANRRPQRPQTELYVPRGMQGTQGDPGAQEQWEDAEDQEDSLGSRKGTSLTHNAYHSPQQVNKKIKTHESNMEGERVNVNLDLGDNVRADDDLKVTFSEQNSWSETMDSGEKTQRCQEALLSSNSTQINSLEPPENCLSSSAVNSKPDISITNLPVPHSDPSLDLTEAPSDNRYNVQGSSLSQCAETPCSNTSDVPRLENDLKPVPDMPDDTGIVCMADVDPQPLSVSTDSGERTTNATEPTATAPSPTVSPRDRAEFVLEPESDPTVIEKLGVSEAVGANSELQKHAEIVLEVGRVDSEPAEDVAMSEERLEGPPSNTTETQGNPSENPVVPDLDEGNGDLDEASQESSDGKQCDRPVTDTGSSSECCPESSAGTGEGSGSDNSCTVSRETTPPNGYCDNVSDLIPVSLNNLDSVGDSEVSSQRQNADGLPMETECDERSPESESQPVHEVEDCSMSEGEGHSDLRVEGHMPEDEGEGQSVVEGEGQPALEGESQSMVEDKGETDIKGEGQPALEVEGQSLREGEGESMVEQETRSEGQTKESEKTAATKDPEEEQEEDSWDAMFDDDGECLDPSAMEELTKTVGKVKIQKTKINYLDYQPKDKTDMNFEAYGHIIEIYDFPAEFVTRDLIVAYQAFMSRGFDLKWVDDTHALGIFSSSIAARDALLMLHPLMKSRPLSEASRQSKVKARSCSEFLLPFKARPETSASAARRLVSGALGLAAKVPREQRDKERQQLRDAKAKRKQDRKNREDIWEGTYGKCAMDEEGT